MCIACCLIYVVGCITYYRSIRFLFLLSVPIFLQFDIWYSSISQPHQTKLYRHTYGTVKLLTICVDSYALIKNVNDYLLHRFNHRNFFCGNLLYKSTISCGFIVLFIVQYALFSCSIKQKIHKTFIRCPIISSLLSFVRKHAGNLAFIEVTKRWANVRTFCFTWPKFTNCLITFISPAGYSYKKLFSREMDLSPILSSLSNNYFKT